MVKLVELLGCCCCEDGGFADPPRGSRSASLEAALPSWAKDAAGDLLLPLSDVALKRKLGEGACGTVRKATVRGADAAVKIVNLTRHGRPRDMLREVLEEADLHRTSGAPARGEDATQARRRTSASWPSWASRCGGTRS